MADRRQLRSEVQAGRAPLLRILRPLRWPWRDDPQRALLLRDRPERQGQVGHPGTSVSLAMVGARAAPGGAYAKDLRGNRRLDGRPHAGAGAERRRQGHRSRRLDHSRSRWDNHGIRCEDFGDQSVVPDLGCAEPLCHRRRRVRIQRGQESDPHDHGPGVARGGPHPRAHAAQGVVMDRRTSIKWVLAASAAWPLSGKHAARADPAPTGRGYGTDPNLLAVYHPGELWPLTFTAPQRRLAGILAPLTPGGFHHPPGAPKALRSPGRVPKELFGGPPPELLKKPTLP